MNDPISPDPEHISGKWVSLDPGRLIEPGHNAGDLLDAPNWELLDEADGYVRVRALLPQRLTNPRGQLFGGFTPTYVDLISLLAVRAGPKRTDPEHAREWLSTINMRLDYLAPIEGPSFEISARLVYRAARIAVVDAQFHHADTLAVLAHTTLRVQ